MVTVPPRHYCTVANPVSRDAQGSVLFDVTGQVRLRHADLEIRLAQDPFPLYPGEVLEKVSALPPLYPLYLSCYRTAFRRENNLELWEGRGPPIVVFTGGGIDSLPSAGLPQMPPSSSHAHSRLAPCESCQPISPPNQPGSRAC